MKSNCISGSSSCRLSVFTVLFVVAFTLPNSARSDDGFTPGKWLESGVTEKMMGYRPGGFPLSDTAPAELKKAPDGLVSPRYGTFKTGAGELSVTHVVIVDFDPQSKPTRLYVDAEGNGDLSATAPAEWTTKSYERPDGTQSGSDFSSATVKLTADGKLRGEFEFYNNRADLTKAGPLPKVLNYHTDCGLGGELVVSGRKLEAVIADSNGSGQFGAGTNRANVPLMWVDVNGNGKADRGETSMLGRPFQVESNWWVATNLTASGAFQLLPSAKPVPPKPLVDLSPGKKAPVFTAKKTDGNEVKFPEDFKGKVVLLDFWATWCGPCVAELPNVVKAYGKYHEQGLEILGISLDKEDSLQKLTDFTKKKNMPWPQVYDGKFWSAAVAKLYGINAIPHMLLVDGDTGVILADKDIRGEALAPAIEKALAGKKK